MEAVLTSQIRRYKEDDDCINISCHLHTFAFFTKLTPG